MSKLYQFESVPFLVLLNIFISNIYIKTTIVSKVRIKKLNKQRKIILLINKKRIVVTTENKYP